MAKEKQEIDKEYLIKSQKLVIFVAFLAKLHNKDSKAKNYKQIDSCIKYIFTLALQTLSELDVDISKVLFEVCQKVVSEEQVNEVLENMFKIVNNDTYKISLNLVSSLAIEDYENNNAAALKDNINKGN